MLKRTSSWLRKSKIVFVAFVSFCGVFLVSPISVFAQGGSVNMQVNVIERKPTDTINDFLTPTFSQTVSEQGRVLGASTERQAIFSKVKWLPKFLLLYSNYYILCLLI